MLATWGRVAALEARVKLRGAQSERLTPLGYDRAWNRFWLLGTLLPASPGAASHLITCQNNVQSCRSSSHFSLVPVNPASGWQV